MNKFEILKEWYYKEEERKEALNNNINIQIGILSIIVAGIYFLSTKYNFDTEKCIKCFYIGILIISSVSWIISIIFLMFAYHAYQYAYFSNPYFIDDEYKKIKPYYDQYKEQLEAKGITIDILLQDSIENQIKQSIAINVNLNDRKSGYIYKSKLCLFISIISLFISSLFYIFNFINNPKDEVQIVKIINSMAKDDFLPPPPPNNPPRLVREGHVPKVDPGTITKTPTPTPPKPTPNKK